MKIVTVAEMKRIDQACVDRGIPVSTLMENAGRAVAEAVRGYLGALKDASVLCLVGGGNNGGDGLVAARYLHEWGAEVNVALCWHRAAADANLKLTRERGIPCVDAAADGNLEHVLPLLSRATCVIDGLLGTGNSRPLDYLYKQVLEAVIAERDGRDLTVVAIDVPSGMDADTGACDDACPTVDLTVTLGFPKPGLFTMPGAARIGELMIADIGIPEDLAAASAMELLTDDWAAAALPPRPRDANKGTFGKLLVVAGSINYTGAAALACGGALRSGAGLVTLATAASLHPVIAGALPEVTHLPLPEGTPGHIGLEAAAIVGTARRTYSAVLAGCGLGQDADTVKFIRTVVRQKTALPLVLDADALNALAGLKTWWRALPDCVLTPHPGEMARLSGLAIGQIQSDRVAAARTGAAKWGKTVVLKGAHTVIAAADGRLMLSPFATAALATAGTGDVLAGIIGGLLAQGVPAYEAACLGVYLHGATAARLASENGDTGMLASDLLPEIPLTIHDLRTSGEADEE